MSTCCAIPNHSDKKLTICSVCCQKGLAVLRTTPEHLLRVNRVTDLLDTQYFFCPNRTCEVIYFSKETNQIFTKKDLRVRVGIKETEDPIPICYCFDYTRERIFDEIRTTGESTALSFITDKVKSGECACEIKNPCGRCCLGGVKQTIKEGKSLYAPKVGDAMGN